PSPPRPTPSPYTTLFRSLRLIRLADELPSLLQDASKKDLAYSDFLEEVLSREIAAKHERHTAMKTAMARFPFQKSLESFDFKFQDRKSTRLNSSHVSISY